MENLLPLINIESGKRYLCRSLSGFDTSHCSISIDQGDIEATLVRFDEKTGLFHQRKSHEPQQLHLQSEENWIASMFKNVLVSQRSVGGEKGVVSQTVASNITLIGRDKWAEIDKVRRLTFRIPSSETLFQSTNLYKELMENDVFSESNRTLLEFETCGMRIQVEYWMTSLGVVNRPNSVYPVFSIEFQDKKSPSDALECIRMFESFFSFISGGLQYFSDAQVNRYSSAEIEERVEGGEPCEGHDLYSFYRKDRPSSEQLDRYHTPLDVFDSESTLCFEKSLAYWINNYGDINASAWLMIESLALRGTISPNRLLVTTRWFEAIECTKAKKAITKADTRILSKIISRNATKLGYEEPIRQRFAGAVSKIADETNHRRFERLLGAIRDVFGENVIGKNSIEWMQTAFRLRGDAAHGGGSKSDNEFQLTSFAIDTLEAVNLLLMLKDFPLGSEEKKRVRNHKLLEKYNLGARSYSPQEFV